VVRLRRRRDFVAVAGTRRRWVAPAFVLQAGPRGAPDEIGLGFTASRRIGNAVARNRARRRLRAAARAILPGAARPGYDYVLVARPAILTCPFNVVLSDLATAFARVVRARPARGADDGSAASPAGRSDCTGS
jgi:ribonuclease P protein component